MAEWLYEAGIGEARAALVLNDHILAAEIETEDDGVRAGAIVEARLTHIVVPGRRAIVTLAGGGEALIEPVPPRVAIGATLLVEVHRAALPERDRVKRAIVRAAPDGVAPGGGPDLLTRIRSSGDTVRILSQHGPDLLELAGWSELIEEAASGEALFDGGALRLALTPAMTLIDVDGWLPAVELAEAGAVAAARMILRHGIGGSIGIDLPTIEGKTARQAAARAIDTILPQPFERTGVNGFGFVQIVRRRARASLPERMRDDPVGVAARSLLRRAERTPGAGLRTLSGAPAVIGLIAGRSSWAEELSRRLGAPIALRAEPRLAISGGHVEAENP